MSIATFSPSDTITFERLDTKCETFLTITNTSTTNLAFKIKTTNPRCYIVKPNNGILEHNGTQKVTITSQVTSMIIPSKTDKFQIQYNTTDNTPTYNVDTMNEYWKTSSENIQTNRFTIKFIDEGTSAKSTTNLGAFASVVDPSYSKKDEEEKKKLKEEIESLKYKLNNLNLGTNDKSSGGVSIVTLIMVLLLSVLIGFVLGNKSGLSLPF
eukprot:Mrub_08354.p1 GENE.Mrub_08354~~Mrub_08354.p1  ORF type:complete len:211 (-),score=39.32 Mrub_08354:159-791(-)